MASAEFGKQAGEEGATVARAVTAASEASSAAALAFEAATKATQAALEVTAVLARLAPPKARPTSYVGLADVRSKIWRVLFGWKDFNASDRVRFCLGWLGVILAASTIVVVACGLLNYSAESQKEQLKRLVLGPLVFWTLVPPMFFWFDYFVLWHLDKASDDRQFADLSEFKHGQDVSRNLWLAMVAVLAAIYTGIR
jgi:hypothetical protein